mmetsp:Transcript_57811/g.124188  ORF Transcript_57811/g.124188 Transcript_57811/m.124188 type:complete len:287 (+) Transcript_57811:537-1397(+)
MASAVEPRAMTHRESPAFATRTSGLAPPQISATTAVQPMPSGPSPLVQALLLVFSSSSSSSSSSASPSCSYCGSELDHGPGFCACYCSSYSSSDFVSSHPFSCHLGCNCCSRRDYGCCCPLNRCYCCSSFCSSCSQHLQLCPCLCSSSLPLTSMPSASLPSASPLQQQQQLHELRPELEDSASSPSLCHPPAALLLETAPPAHPRIPQAALVAERWAPLQPGWEARCPPSGPANLLLPPCALRLRSEWPPQKAASFLHSHLTARARSRATLLLPQGEENSQLLSRP